MNKVIVVFFSMFLPICIIVLLLQTQGQDINFSMVNTLESLKVFKFDFVLFFDNVRDILDILNPIVDGSMFSNYEWNNILDVVKNISNFVFNIYQLMFLSVKGLVLGVYSLLKTIFSALQVLYLLIT